ncbi:DUF3613 domain-containing protein [Hydrogenophaga sp.]|uniref:DUF3613 domain-containing protein n=1 Tax=Hydrogenophaga sp. TaxID=1904254 RepID=UPI00260D53C3|nr:DUF3613 domain-containing protein [Hydrogenophaga sp.]MCW5652849.1 DUF3613 domain-containing protein [Hydrogenophaga sp.]
MRTRPRPSTIARPCGWVLGMLLSTSLWAQDAPAMPATTAAPAPMQIGDATRSLLQRQRLGHEASATPRPIDGSVADLSHQRYLKSFQQPLPTWFGSRVQGEAK